MAESVHLNFPKQNVSDDEKNSIEYGKKIAKAISAELSLIHISEPTRPY